MLNKKIEKPRAFLMPFFYAIPVFIWQILFFFAPIFFIIGLSLRCPGTATWTPTLRNFFYFFSTPYIRIIIRSLTLALFNACACLVLAYPIAYFLVFKVSRFKNFFIFLLIVPFCTSFLLHIYAWFFILERNGFLNRFLLSLGLVSQPLHMLNSMTAVNIMMVYYYFPFMVMPIYNLLEKFNRELIEASLDLGASWLQTIRKIMIPLSLPGILSGLFLVFVPSFAEFAIPELLGGDKKMFVGSVVSHYILGGTTISQGAAFTLISACILTLSVFALHRLIKKCVKGM